MTLSQALTFEPSMHVYRLGDLVLPSVTEILGAVGVRSSFASVHPDVLERKRQLGAAVHVASHYDDEGTLDPSTVDPRVLEYLEGWRAFRRDYGFVPNLLETSLHDPTLLVAGTLDRAGCLTRLGGAEATELHVIDLKCGDAEDAGADWQTAAYAKMLADALVQPALLVRPRYVVELTPGDYKVIRYPATLRAYREFCAFVTTFRAQHGRRPRLA